MNDNSQETVNDQSGIERTPTGEIVDQAPKPVDTTKDSTAKDDTSGKETTQDNQGDKPKDKEESLLTEKKPEAKSTAPEKYEAFKVPEGYELDAKVDEEARGLFKGLGLSQDQAQSLVDLYAKHSAESADAPYKAWRDQQEAWRTEIKADPEIGGKLDEVRTTVAKAIDGLGDPKLASDFREAMTYTGAGNNPAFIRAFYKLAQKVTEGGPVTGNNPSKFGQGEQGGRRSIASALYPNLPS
jgi:hypothetical protein